MWPCLVLCFYELVWESVRWLPANFIAKLCLGEHCAWLIFLGQYTQLLLSFVFFFFFFRTQAFCPRAGPGGNSRNCWALVGWLYCKSCCQGHQDLEAAALGSVCIVLLDTSMAVTRATCPKELPVWPRGCFCRHWACIQGHLQGLGIPGGCFSSSSWVPSGLGHVLTFLSNQHWLNEDGFIFLEPLASCPGKDHSIGEFVRYVMKTLGDFCFPQNINGRGFRRSHFTHMLISGTEIDTFVSETSFHI